MVWAFAFAMNVLAQIRLTGADAATLSAN